MTRFIDLRNLNQTRTAFTNAFGALSGLTIDRESMFNTSVQMLKVAERRYKKGLENILHRFEIGELTKQEALSQFKALATDVFRNAFNSGALRAGNPYYERLGLTAEDKKHTQDVSNSEAGFWRKFENDVEEGLSSKIKMRRLKMYVNNLVSQYWTGYIAGLPDDAQIAWVMGHPKTEHCPDCISIAANSPYTKRTLPTVPRAGDTACLHNCYCKLMEVTAGINPTMVPGRVSIPQNYLEGGLNAEVTTQTGAPAPPNVTDMFNSLYAEVNRLRQLMEVDQENLMTYINARKELLQQIRRLADTHKVYVTPLYRVRDIITAVNSMEQAGWRWVQHPAVLSIGEMIREVKGVAIVSGLVVRINGNQILVDTPLGRRVIDVAQSLVFRQV